MKRPIPVLSILVTPPMSKTMVRFPSRRRSSTSVTICSLSVPIITLPATLTTTAPGATSLWLISIAEGSVYPEPCMDVKFFSSQGLSFTEIYNRDWTPFSAEHIYQSGRRLDTMIRDDEAPVTQTIAEGE